MRAPAGNLEYRGFNILLYQGVDLLTNTEYSDWGSFLYFVEAFNNTEYNQTIYDPYFVPKSTIYYVAASVLLGNLNSVIGKANDFYMYADTVVNATGQMEFIPFNFYSAFGIPTCNFSSNDIATSDIFSPPFCSGNLKDYPLIDKILNVESYKQMYLQDLEFILTWTFNEEFIKGAVKYLRWMANPYARQESGNLFNHDDFLCATSITQEEIESYCSNSTQMSIYEFYQIRSASVRKQMLDYGWKFADPFVLPQAGAANLEVSFVVLIVLCLVWIL